ncbi:unnamed protein product [Albugo candida]|uniref:Uncharacterized protein n=1 Tax=Albugo candida TaxID=65357 RepID=A0A024G9J0_9STRA|nr:unnamed protein product [Albugo candida]|eukprot:CCI43334.1 unnamed protein product [Albugo candida]
MCIRSLATRYCVTVYYLATRVKAQTDIHTFVPKLHTTYCWEIKRAVDAMLWGNFSSINEQRESNACPIQLELGLSQSTATQLFVDQEISLAWTATVAPQSSANVPLWSGGSTLYSTDALQSLPFVQITASNLKSCKGGSAICNPFFKGDQFEETTEQKGSFTAQKAVFSTNSASSFKFSSPGSYIVFAHITIPGNDPKTTRYDFVYYIILAIQNGMGDYKSNEDNPSFRSTLVSSKRAPSETAFTSTIIALLVIFGVVVVLLLALMCFLKFKIGNDKEAIEIELQKDREKIHQERKNLQKLRNRQRDTRPGAFLSASLLLDCTPPANDLPPPDLAFVGNSLTPNACPSSPTFEASSGDRVPDDLLPAVNAMSGIIQHSRALEKTEELSSSKESQTSSYSSAFVDPGCISIKASRERGTIDIGSCIDNARTHGFNAEEGSLGSQSFSAVEDLLHAGYYSMADGTLTPNEANIGRKGPPLILDELLDQQDANSIKRKFRKSIS